MARPSSSAHADDQRRVHHLHPLHDSRPSYDAAQSGAPGVVRLCRAATYGVIQALHLVFGLFYALLVVAAIRGLSLHVLDLWRKTRETAVGPRAGAVRLELRPG